MLNNYCVYKHTCPNGKVYVGITSLNPLVRWKNGYGYHNQVFYRAILKYGWDNIKHEILCEGLSKEQACQKEIELIACYKSNQSEFGYNVDGGGKAVGSHPISIESRTKMSLSHKNVPLSDSHKNAISLALKGKTNCHKGTHLSDEHKEKLSKKLSKAVCQFDLKGNLIATYVGINAASKITDVCGSNIVRCCKGERLQAGGFTWRYKNDCEI